VRSTIHRHASTAKPLPSQLTEPYFLFGYTAFTSCRRRYSAINKAPARPWCFFSFKSLAHCGVRQQSRTQNSSASTLLKQFIDRYLEGVDVGIDLEAIAPASDVNSQIDKALALIWQEVEELQEKLESLTILGNQAKEPRT